MTQMFPQLLGEVRSIGGQQQTEGLQNLSGAILASGDLIDEGHHLRNGSVEGEALRVCIDLGDGFVEDSHLIFRGR